MADRELHLFVDNSNVLLEGRRFAEMRRKHKPRPMDVAERLHTVQPPRTILITEGDADYVPAVLPP